MTFLKKYLEHVFHMSYNFVQVCKSIKLDFNHDILPYIIRSISYVN